MPHQLQIRRIVVVWLCLTLTALLHSQISPSKDKVTTMHAAGTFDVKLTPQAPEEGDSGLGRMSLDKQFHGDLEGTAKGFMLSSAAAVVKGSGGYVAMEKVTGTLKGRVGSFVLQHSGTMNRGIPTMNISVVPDSGTGQLEGIAGTFTIKIDQGKHSFEFDYTLPSTM